MKVVLVRFKDGERRDFPLTGDSVVLGRRPECGLRIASSDVSRQHCQLTVKGKELTIKDLGSSNGTYVNGKRVAETKLTPGDRLAVGPAVFVIQIDGKPATIKPSDAVVERPAAKPAAPKGEEDVFELGEDDFEIDDAMTAIDDLDDEKDMP